MAPSGLPDDPVVIDDHMENTKESFIEMRKKLVALQMEIQEVIERQEEEIRRQEEKELNDYCRSHHILIVNKEEEEEEEYVMKNPLKRSRSSSSPPPLIPIHEVNIDDDEEDAMDFLQVSMAHDSKRLKRTGRSQQHRDWAVMHPAGAKVEPVHQDGEEDDEVEIVNEVMGGTNVQGEETAAGGCMRHEIANLGGNLFTKVEIVWPKETGRSVEALEIVADRNEGPNNNTTEPGIDMRGKHFGGRVGKEEFDPVVQPAGDDKGNAGRGDSVNCNINTSNNEDDIEIINEIIKEAKRKEEEEEEEEGNDLMMEEEREEMDMIKESQEMNLMKEKMRAFQEKKKQYWEIQDKANRIIDSTRARAKFDQQAVNEDTEKVNEGTEVNNGCGDTMEPYEEVYDGDEEEEELVYGDRNFEYKDNGCEATNDEEEMATKDDEGRKDGIETPVIPMELLNEVDTLNNMKQGAGALERWSGKDMMLQGCQDASRNVAIWKKIGAIFIVNKFFEFLEERGYHVSVTRNMVAAC